MTDSCIVQLAGYGLVKGLIQTDDLDFVINQLLMVLEKDDFCGDAAQALDYDESRRPALSEIRRTLTDYAVKQGLTAGDSTAARDLFDTRLMGVLTPRPSQVREKFRSLYAKDPVQATDWYYRFSGDTNYIRRDRIARDRKWKTSTPYGDLDITINLSKPEKDPRAIDAARRAPQTSYPKCQLCRENEGYAGRLNHPARQNHRIIPLTLQGDPWFLQYSPYVYYNEHCIVFNREHVPMKIDGSTFRRLFDFVRLFPHYFVGSNADLPIVGGSILSHEHFQGGRCTFAMEKAPVERSFTISGFTDVTSGVVRWPMTCLRLTGPDPDRIVLLAEHILSAWRSYSDPGVHVLAETDGQPHNTITPIARRRGADYEMDLVLRNNITTADRPLGLFHPGPALHHIKKENIGLIEVMGMAVLPARLRSEMDDLRRTVLTGGDLRASETTALHADWFESLARRYDRIDADNINQILREEIGRVFCEVLEDAGVFKRTPQGQAALDRFLSSL